MKNKYGTLVTDSILFVIGNLGIKIVSFLMVPFYTYILSTAEYGTIDLFQTSMNFIIPFVSLSIGDAIVRFAASEKYDRQHVFNNALVISIVGSILMFLLLPLYSLYYPLRNWRYYFCIITILNLVNSVFATYNRSIGKIHLFVSNSLIVSILTAGLNIITLYVLKLGLFGYFISIIVANAISFIFWLIMTKKSLCNNLIFIDKKLMKEMLLFSSPMIINAVSWSIFSLTDRVMIQHMNGESGNGIYSVATKIPSFLSVVTTTFIQAWSLSAIREYDSTKDTRFYENVYNVFSTFLAIISSAIIAFIKPFMNVYVGNNFFEAWRYAPFLVLGIYFSSQASYFGSIYTAAMKNIKVTISTAIAAICNIILNYFLILNFDILGAAIATMCSYMVLCFYRMFDSRQYIKFNIPWIKLFSSMIMLMLQSIGLIYEIPIIIQGVFIIIILAINKNNMFVLIRKAKNIIGKIIEKRRIMK